VVELAAGAGALGGYWITSSARSGTDSGKVEVIDEPAVAITV
jgi:hypothetical protein